MRASVGGRLVGLTQGRYATVMQGVKQWRPRRVGGGSPALGGRAGPIVVSQHFTPEEITTRYRVSAKNARTELRIPFWGKLKKRTVTPVSNGIKIETENSEGGKVGRARGGGHWRPSSWTTTPPPRHAVCRFSRFVA